MKECTGGFHQFITFGNSVPSIDTMCARGCGMTAREAGITTLECQHRWGMNPDNFHWCDLCGKDTREKAPNA